MKISEIFVYMPKQFLNKVNLYTGQAILFILLVFLTAGTPTLLAADSLIPQPKTDSAEDERALARTILRQATQLILKIEEEDYNNEEEKNRDLHLIVSSQLNEHLKDTTGALQTINLMPEGSYYKDWAFIRLGYLHTQAGEDDAASKFFQQARRSISSIRNPVQQVSRLGRPCLHHGRSRETT